MSKFSFYEYPISEPCICCKCNRVVSPERCLVIDQKTPYGSRKAYALGLCAPAYENEFFPEDAPDDADPLSWRLFCKDCFAEVSQQDPEEVFNTYRGEGEIGAPNCSGVFYTRIVGTKDCIGYGFPPGPDFLKFMLKNQKHTNQACK